jgi:hypothetical protein
MGVRRAVARPEGEDDLDAAVARYEQSALPERMKVALRVTDAFLAGPSRLDAATQADALQHFAPADIVELAFKLISYSGNKSTVALRLDGALVDGEPVPFRYVDGAPLIDGFDDVDPRPGR